MFFFAVLLMLAIVLFACIMNAYKSYNVSVIMHGVKNCIKILVRVHDMQYSIHCAESCA